MKQTTIKSGRQRLHQGIMNKKFTMKEIHWLLRVRNEKQDVGKLFERLANHHS